MQKLRRTAIILTTVALVAVTSFNALGSTIKGKIQIRHDPIAEVLRTRQEECRIDGHQIVQGNKKSSISGILGSLRSNESRLLDIYCGENNRIILGSKSVVVLSGDSILNPLTLALPAELKEGRIIGPERIEGKDLDGKECVFSISGDAINRIN